MEQEENQPLFELHYYIPQNGKLTPVTERGTDVQALIRVADQHKADRFEIYVVNDAYNPTEQATEEDLVVWLDVTNKGYWAKQLMSNPELKKKQLLREPVKKQPLQQDIKFKSPQRPFADVSGHVVALNEYNAKNLPTMKKLSEHLITEKWDKDVKIDNTGENTDKTIAQLKKEKTGADTKTKQQKNFAIRAKEGWPKGHINELDHLPNYAIPEPHYEVCVGFMKLAKHRLGGMAVFQVQDDDSFGKQIGADYLVELSRGEQQYVLKPYGNNNYVINQNPLFHIRYMKVNPETRAYYILSGEEDGKFQYQGKYQELVIDPNRRWSPNGDAASFKYKVEKLKRDGATFHFGDEASKAGVFDKPAASPEQQMQENKITIGRLLETNLFMKNNPMTADNNIKEGDPTKGRKIKNYSSNYSLEGHSDLVKEPTTMVNLNKNKVNEMETDNGLYQGGTNQSMAFGKNSPEEKAPVMETEPRFDQPIKELSTGLTNKAADIASVRSQRNGVDPITAQRKSSQSDTMSSYINPAVKALFDPLGAECWKRGETIAVAIPSSQGTDKVHIQIDKDNYQVTNGDIKQLAPNMLPRLQRAIQKAQEDLKTPSKQPMAECSTVRKRKIRMTEAQKAMLDELRLLQEGIRKISGNKKLLY